LVVALALVLRDRLCGDGGERHVAEVALQRDEPPFLELDRARRAVQALAVDVCVHRPEQALRSLFVRGDGAVTGLFAELPFLPLGVLQVRRVQTRAVATAIDREVRPILASALPEAHDRTSSMPVRRSDDGSGLASTALARTNSSRSAGRERTARPS